MLLQKSDGNYFGKKNYTVEITKEGYKKQIIPIAAYANGWYVGENLIFGGLVGWLIVDPFNGGMYTLSPEQVTSTLGEDMAHNNKATDGGVSIVLLQDVPHQLRSQMKKVN